MPVGSDAMPGPSGTLTVPPQVFMYSSTPSVGSCGIVPVTPLAGLRVTKMVASDFKVWLLTDEGDMFCIADEGQLRRWPKPASSEFIDIAAGPEHVVVLVKHARGPEVGYMMMGIGNNRHGQLGFPDTAKQKTLRVIKKFSTAPISVHAGPWHSAVILANQVLLYGGTSSYLENSGPEVVTCEMKQIVQVAMGTSHLLVLTGDGSVYMRGSHCSLDIHRESLQQCYEALWGSTCVQIAAGDACSFVVTSDGDVFAWGVIPKALLTAPSNLVSGIIPPSTVPKGEQFVPAPKRIRHFDRWLHLSSVTTHPTKKTARTQYPALSPLVAISHHLKLSPLQLVPGLIDRATGAPLHKALRQYWITRVAQPTSRFMVFCGVPDKEADGPLADGSLLQAATKDATPYGQASGAPRVPSSSLNTIIMRRVKDANVGSFADDLDVTWQDLAAGKLSHLGPADAWLVVDGTRIPIHRAFIAARCSGLSKIMYSDIPLDVPAVVASGAGAGAGAGAAGPASNNVVAEVAHDTDATATAEAVIAPPPLPLTSKEGLALAYCGPSTFDITSHVADLATESASAAEVVTAVVQFLYQERLPAWCTEDTVMALLTAATRWDMPSLEACCQLTLITVAGGLGDEPALMHKFGARKVAHDMDKLLRVAQLSGIAAESIEKRSTLQEQADIMSEVATEALQLITSIAVPATTATPAPDAVAGEDSATALISDVGGAEVSADAAAADTVDATEGEEEGAPEGKSDSADEDESVPFVLATVTGQKGELRGRRRLLAQRKRVLRAVQSSAAVREAVRIAAVANRTTQAIAQLPYTMPQMEKWLQPKWELSPEFAGLREMVFGSPTPYDGVPEETVEAAERLMGVEPSAVGKTKKSRRGKNKRRKTRLRERRDVLNRLKAEASTARKLRRARMKQALQALQGDVWLRTSDGAMYRGHSALICHRLGNSALVPAILSARDTHAGVLLHDSLTEDSIGAWMQYLYTGDCEVTERTAVPLLVAAKEYNMQHLVNLATQHLISSFATVANAGPLLQLAEAYGCERLAKYTSALVHAGEVQVLSITSPDDAEHKQSVAAAASSSTGVAPEGAMDADDINARRERDHHRDVALHRRDRERALANKADGRAARGLELEAEADEVANQLDTSVHLRQRGWADDWRAAACDPHMRERWLQKVMGYKHQARRGLMAGYDSAAAEDVLLAQESAVHSDDSDSDAETALVAAILDVVSPHPQLQLRELARDFALRHLAQPQRRQADEDETKADPAAAEETNNNNDALPGISLADRLASAPAVASAWVNAPSLVRGPEQEGAGGNNNDSDDESGNNNGSEDEAVPDHLAPV